MLDEGVKLNENTTQIVILFNADFVYRK